jgi:outer membrane protein OmpA-like peptidoglycan-associated protein
MRWLIVFLLACSGSTALVPAPARAVTPPSPPDIDRDRILDANDLCPNDAEDVDGFQDDDGCPEADNDQDKIADADDKCPNDPETYNATDDEDGCPDKGCVLVKQFPMCIDDRIFFGPRQSVPGPGYDPILDNIAEAMKLTSPDVELVELRGFRSGDEPAGTSKRRAASVHAALVKRGVDAARLVITDGGVGHPRDSPNGQRRVEPQIVKQRVQTIEQADVINCTPMGRYFEKLTDEEKRARCAH